MGGAVPHACTLFIAHLIKYVQVIAPRSVHQIRHILYMQLTDSYNVIRVSERPRVASHLRSLHSYQSTMNSRTVTCGNLVRFRNNGTNRLGVH